MGLEEACWTCLSRGRFLAPLALPLRALCAELLAPITYKSLDGMRLCWECDSTLRKTLRFKLRATRAQRWLECARKLPKNQVPFEEPISSLSTSMKSCYDLELTFEDSFVKEDVKKDMVEEKEYSDNGNFEPLIDSSEYLGLVDEKDIVVKTEPIDMEVLVEYDPAVNIAERKKKLRPKGLKYKKRYNLLVDSKRKSSQNESDLSMFYVKSITQEEMLRIREQDRNDVEYLNSKHRCDTCIMTFHSESKLQQHVKKYHSPKVGGAECAVCGARFADAARRDEHAARHLRCYRCRLCAAVARRAHDMRRHCARAHAARTYQCVHCDVAFETLRDRTRHRQELHKCYVCDACGLRFQTSRTIEKHIFSRHMPFHCGECGLQVSSRHALRLHKYRRHESHAPDAAAYCVECDKQYRHRLAYRAHLKMVHRARAQFACPECGKQFSRKIYMQNHLDLLHRNSSKNQCQLCNKAFLRPDALRRHTQHVHEGKSLPKTKVCDICGRAFQTNRILVNHRRTHTGERPYECELCSAAFAQKTALKSHVKHIHMHVVRGK